MHANEKKIYKYSFCTQLLVTDLTDWLQWTMINRVFTKQQGHAEGEKSLIKLIFIYLFMIMLHFETKNSSIKSRRKSCSELICELYKCMCMVGLGVSHSNTNTALLKSSLRVLDSVGQSGAETCYLQTPGGWVETTPEHKAHLTPLLSMSLLCHLELKHC